MGKVGFYEDLNSLLCSDELPRIRARRVTASGKRWYQALNSINGVERGLVVSGLTGLLDQMQEKRESERLENFKDQFLLRYNVPSSEYVDMLAGYGSIVDEIMSNCLSTGVWDFDLAREELTAYYLSEKTFGSNVGHVVESGVKALASIAQWQYETNAEVLAVQYMVMDEGWGVGTPIDIVARIPSSYLKKKNSLKGLIGTDSIFAVINLKTGKPGDWHEPQSCAELMLFERFTGIKNCLAFRLHPKEFTGSKPSYQFDLLTPMKQSIYTEQLIDKFERAAKFGVSKPPGSYLSIGGSIPVGKDPSAAISFTNPFDLSGFNPY